MTLNTSQKKYLYWSFSFISMLGISMSIYYAMDGFEEISMVESNNNHYSIAGKTIKGIGVYREEKLLWEEVKKMIESEKLVGDLCIINYEQDSLKSNEVYRVIGVLLNEEVSIIPSGYFVTEIKAENSFLAALTMHPLVRPNSEKIGALLTSFADSLGFTVRNYSLERHYPDNSVLVELFAE